MRLRLLLTAFLFALLLSPPLPVSKAARGPDPTALNDTGFQLVVFEIAGCTYCSAFRNDIVPAYRASPQAREIPMQFVDLNSPLGGKLGLAAPIQVVPTAVLLYGNREIGRIPGYVGVDAFFQSIKHLRATAP